MNKFFNIGDVFDSCRSSSQCTPFMVVRPDRGGSETRRITGILATILLGISTFFTPQTVYAEDAVALAAYINSWDPGGTGTLEAIVTDSEVTVTGTVTDATEQLELSIDEGVRVNWQASMSGTNNISLSGDGEFLFTSGKIEYLGDSSYALLSGGDNPITVNGGEIIGGIRTSGENSTVTISGDGILTAEDRNVIHISGSDSKIFVIGGTITATNEYAIYATGLNSTVNISGGVVTANVSTVIYIDNQDNTGLNVLVSGGTVKQLGDRHGIYTFGSVEVKGDAEIAAMGSGNTIYLAALDDDSGSGMVTVSGGTVSATTGAGIYAEGSESKVIVTGGTVSASDALGRGIYAFGADSQVIVTGGTISAPNHAISLVGSNTVAFNAGGTVGQEEVYTNEENSLYVVKSGTDVHYVAGTNDDLTVLPADASAVWMIDDGKSGISYTRNTNTAFLEVPGITVLETQYTVTVEQPDPSNGTITVMKGNDPVTDHEAIGSLTPLNLKAEPEDGYKFVQWWDGNTDAERTYVLSGDVIISATFEPSPFYTVTFDFKYEGSQDEEVKVQEGKKVTKPSDPTRDDGYEFAGWIKEGENNAFDFNTPIEGDITLNAQWTKLTGTEIILAPDLNVYPNPFADMLHIVGVEGSILQIINGNGAIVHTQKIEGADAIVHLQHLQQGVYFCRIQKDHQIVTLKIVKN